MPETPGSLVCENITVRNLVVLGACPRPGPCGGNGNGTGGGGTWVRQAA